MVFGVISLPEKFWQWMPVCTSMASQLKSSYFGLYLVVALQNQVLNMAVGKLGLEFTIYINKITVH